MSLYADYLSEREDKHVYECTEGFCVYKFIGPECYIVDIYVKPEHRKHGIAATMADKVAEIAKIKGCKFLTGSVSPSTKNAHSSLLVLIAYGMKLLRADRDIVYLIKEI